MGTSTTILFLALISLGTEVTSQRSEVQNEGGCGEARVSDAGARIVGGQEAPPNFYPWIAQIVFGEMDCGGSLINSRYVLTAAHCLTNMDKRYVRILLAHHCDREEVDVIESSNIESFIIHKSYSDSTDIPHYDIGLIKLRNSIPFTDNVRPICLPTSGNRSAYEGKDAVVAGWGSVGEIWKSPGMLVHVDVTVMSNAQCETTGVGNMLDDYMICAAKPGKDACQGDSGGPLMFLNEHNRYEQIGVVSFGIGCARPNYPGVYTSVGDMLPWINSHINT